MPDDNSVSLDEITVPAASGPGAVPGSVTGAVASNGNTPSALVTYNGTALNQQLSDRLLSITIVDDSDIKNDRIEVLFDDRDPTVDAPADGSVINVQIGYVETGLVDKGNYDFDEYARLAEPGRQLRVVAHAKDTGSAIKTNRNQSYHDTTLGDIANTIAQRLGMSANVVGGLDAIQIPHRDQTGHSDQAFLTQLALENNAIVKMQNGQLILAPRGMTKSASGGDVTNTTIDVSTVKDSWEYLHHSRGDYAGAASQYHDPDSGKTMKAVYPPGSDSDPNAAIHMSPQVQATGDEAKGLAVSNFFATDRSKDTFTFTCPGIAALAAESQITLTGFPPDVPTAWMVSKVVHTFVNAGGYTCECTCEIQNATGSTELGSGAEVKPAGDPDSTADTGNDYTKGDNPVSGGDGN